MGAPSEVRLHGSLHSRKRRVERLRKEKVEMENKGDQRTQQAGR